MIRGGLVKGVLVLVAASGVLGPAAWAADEADVVGTWKLSYNPGDFQRNPTLVVTREGLDLKAEFVDGDTKLEAKGVRFKDGTLRFAIETDHDGEPATAEFEGKVEGNTIAGEAEWEFGGMTGSFPFEGKREAPKPGR